MVNRIHGSATENDLTPLHPAQQIGGTQEFDLRGGQLYCEGQAVQASRDFGNVRGIRRIEAKTRVDGSSPRRKQRYCADA